MRILFWPAVSLALSERRSGGLVQVEPPQGPSGPRRNDLDEPEHRRILVGGEAGMLGRQGFLIGDRWHHLAGGVPAVGVVVLDPGRDLGPGRVPGGEVLHRPELELQRRVPRFDDRVVQGRPGPPHRLGDAQPLAGSLERPGGVFTGLNRWTQHRLVAETVAAR